MVSKERKRVKMDLYSGNENNVVELNYFSSGRKVRVKGLQEVLLADAGVVGEPYGSVYDLISHLNKNVTVGHYQLYQVYTKDDCQKTIAIVVKNDKAYNFRLLGHGSDAGKWYQQGYIIDKEQLDNGSHGLVEYFEYQDQATKYIQDLQLNGTIF